jgi:hypothetical protein
MAILDTLNPGHFDLGSIDISLLGDFLAGTATIHPAALLAGGLVTLFTLAALAVSTVRQKCRTKALEERCDDSHERLQAIEILLANATSEASMLRQRVDQLGIRQESTLNSHAKTGLRQAIALSRHGATTRQLIDTCELSQGEAPLIQTLYGQAAGAPATEELH